MQIVNCRINHVVNPVGFLMDAAPVFTWVTTDATGEKQQAARIVVAADPAQKRVLADTGFRDLDSLGTAVPVKLQPRTRYYWTVTIKSDAGEEASSEVNYFETGKMNEPWQAQWIGCSQQTERHPVFHKSFSVAKSSVTKEQDMPAAGAAKTAGKGKDTSTADAAGRIQSARLYICGLGLYHAYLNGKLVTQEYLTPYCTDYNQWIEYQTYDVTKLLDADSAAETAMNHLDVALGVGWYLGRFGFTSKPSEKCINGYYGDGRFKLLAELIITYEDGSTKTIATDDSWMVTRSNITFSDIYDGEHRDDTLAPAHEEQAQILFPADTLPVTERLSIPVLRHEVIKPVELIHTPAGEQVYDLGQNFAGIWRLRVHAPKGTKIHLQVGEVLQQGNFYNDNLRSAKAEYWYTSDGEAHILEPQFTFYGYRYVKIEGIPDLTIDDFEGIAVYSDITPAGTWECGDQKLNKLMQNISWGQKSNFVDVPTDCPQRDERMGWTADTQVFVPTALYLTDAWAFYRKYLHDLALNQEEYHGMVPDVVPAFGVDSCASVWGDAATFMPWNIYKMSGDKTILEEQLPSMKAWVDYIEAQDGDDHAWGRHFQYGDWLALDNPKGGKAQTQGGTDEAYIAYVYYMASASLVAKAAAVLGKKELADTYNAKAAAIRQYIEDEYFTPHGRCAVATMTGYILALYFYLTSDREKTTGQLVHLIRDAGNKFKTGFVGTPLVSRVLSSMGEDKLAYTIIHNEEYPGWLYEINLGATTVWERWNSMEADGTVSSTDMNSFNHYAYGSIGQWMWETMAGIRPDETMPGFRHAILRPTPDWKTKYVKASYASAAGTYETMWEVVDETHVHVRVRVPFNCTATLILPYAAGGQEKQELSAGVYETTYTLTQPLHKTFTVDTPIGDIMDDAQTLAAARKVNPQIDRIPASMRKMTMRQLIQAFQPEQGADHILTAFNKALAEV